MRLLVSPFVKQIATRSRIVAMSLTLLPTHVAAVLLVTCLQHVLWQARVGSFPVQQTWRHGSDCALVSLHPQQCRAPNPECRNKLLRNGRCMTHAPKRVEWGAARSTRGYNGEALFAALVPHHGEVLPHCTCCCYCCVVLCYALCILLPLQHDMHK